MTEAGVHAATLVILRCGRGWFYKFGTSSPDHLADYPNNLLIKHLVDGNPRGGGRLPRSGAERLLRCVRGAPKIQGLNGARSQPLHYLTNGLPLTTPAAAEFKQFLGGITDTLVDLKADRRIVDPLSERIYRYFA